MYGKNNLIDLSSPMMRGLLFHRASTIRSLVNYSLMTTTGLIGRSRDWTAAVDATVALMRDSSYQKIEIDHEMRPLLFLLYDEHDLERYFLGSLVQMRAVIDALRRMSAKGPGNPYVVIVLSPASAAEAVRIALGADAISEYVAGKRTSGKEAWADFAPTIAEDWDTYGKVAGGGVVPTVRTGADIRARCETPPPFEHRFHSKRCDNFVVNPTDEQLALEFSDAFSWMEQHADLDPARILLVYSWSECDESGNCLMPTVGDPYCRKLRALSSIIHLARAHKAGTH